MKNSIYKILIIICLNIEMVAQNKPVTVSDSIISKISELDVKPVLKFNNSCLLNLKNDSNCILRKVYLKVILSTDGKILKHEFEFIKSSISCSDSGSYQIAKERFMKQLECLIDNVTEAKPGMKNGRPVTTSFNIPITIDSR